MIKVVVSYIKAAADVALQLTGHFKRFGEDSSEAVTPTDSFSRTVTYSRNFSENIPLTDVPGIGKIFIENPDHTVTVVDAIAISTNYSLVFTDSIAGITDTPSWTLGKNAADSITTGDTPGIGAIHKVSPTDGITAGDTPGIGAIHVVSPSETLSVSDVKMIVHDGMLNTNMLNSRILAGGDTEVTGTNVTIT